MTNVEVLLVFICWMLILIWIYIRWICLRLEYPLDKALFSNDVQQCVSHTQQPGQET